MSNQELVPIGYWNFTKRSTFRANSPSWQPTTLQGASLEDGGLRVATNKYAVVTGYTGGAVTEKTLVAWVRLGNLDARGGSALSLDSRSVDLFDGLVYGERVKREWMTGSNGYSQSGAGAAYVFVRSGDHWSQEAYVKASNTGDFDLFGGSVALSHDGGVLAVGAVGEDSLATGVGGPQDDLFSSGAVYVFTRAGRSWSERAFVKAPQPILEFGGAVAFSGDGETLAVGAAREASAAAGIGGEQVDDSRPDAGAVYLY